MKVGRHLEKLKNLNIFGKIWLADASRQSGPHQLIKFHSLKNEDGGGGHLENSKNLNITAMEQPILTTFNSVMQLGPLVTVSK